MKSNLRLASYFLILSQPLVIGMRSRCPNGDGSTPSDPGPSRSHRSSHSYPHPTTEKPACRIDR